MPMAFKSITDYHDIVKNAEDKKLTMTVIGHLDEPMNNMGIGDLILFVGSTKRLQGIDKFLIGRMKMFLVCNHITAKHQVNQLMLFDEVVFKTSCVTKDVYNECITMVKLVNGLNNYGFSSQEVYQYLLKCVSEFFELTDEKGDY